MDKLDRSLLDMVQEDIPLTRSPFNSIALALDITTEELLMRLQQLKKEGLIRRFGAVFDAKQLGYCSTLCAMKVPVAMISDTASIVNSYAHVTHNYLRNHYYNMWFTLTAPSCNELQRLMKEIQQKCGIEELIDLPALRVFKIKVTFPLQPREAASQHANESTTVQTSSVAEVPNDLEKDIIRAMQGDFELCDDPFALIAAKLSIDPDSFLEKVETMKAKGYLRRIGAILYHRLLGFEANAMSVWKAHDRNIEASGQIFAGFSSVSHCYQRRSHPSFPYNLFAMIHERDSLVCEELAKKIAGKTGLNHYRLLYSSEEFKKISMQFFPKED
jgi:siroheme decarboxylase